MRQVIAALKPGPYRCSAVDRNRNKDKRQRRNAMSTKKIGLDALLTPEDSVLLLIDHQPFQFANLQLAPDRDLGQSAFRPPAPPRKPAIRDPATPVRVWRGGGRCAVLCALEVEVHRGR